MCNVSLSANSALWKTITPSLKNPRPRLLRAGLPNKAARPRAALGWAAYYPYQISDSRMKRKLNEIENVFDLKKESWTKKRKHSNWELKSSVSVDHDPGWRWLDFLLPRIDAILPSSFTDGSPTPALPCDRDDVQAVLNAFRGMHASEVTEVVDSEAVANQSEVAVPAILSLTISNKLNSNGLQAVEAG